MQQHTDASSSGHAGPLGPCDANSLPGGGWRPGCSPAAARWPPESAGAPCAPHLCPPATHPAGMPLLFQDLPPSCSPGLHDLACQPAHMLSPQIGTIDNTVGSPPGSMSDAEHICTAWLAVVRQPGCPQGRYSHFCTSKQHSAHPGRCLSHRDRHAVLSHAKARRAVCFKRWLLSFL